VKHNNENKTVETELEAVYRTVRTIEHQVWYIQSNVIKTMILVCAIYAVTWLPENIYYLMVNMDADLTFRESAYYAVLFVLFQVYSLHTCSPGGTTRPQMPCTGVA